MSAQVAEVTDWRLWVVASVAVLSLAWNIYNTVQTNRHRRATDANRDAIQRMEREHKARSIRLEEFRSAVRDPVRTALSEVPSLIKRIEAASQTKISIDELGEEIALLNRDAIATIGYVSDALEQANNSPFADGSDWLDGISLFEDEVAEAFNIAQDTAKSQVIRFQALQTAHQKMSVLKKTINERVDRGVESYAKASESDLLAQV